MPQFGGAPKCPRCNKSVYHAEELKAGGQSWHKLCHKCSLCNKMLDSTSVAPRDDDLFCKNCYGKQFGPKGYGFGQGAGTLSMDSGERFGLKADPTRVAPSTAEAYVSADLASSACGRAQDCCPRCGKTVYMAEKMIGANSSWHKKCFTCFNCNKRLDSTNLSDRGGEIFCKTCYNKGYGPKGIGYGVGAGTLSAD